MQNSSKKTRKRLDILLQERGLAQSRERAKALIMSGKVLVNHQPIDKPGTQVEANVQIDLKGKDIPYVSRGGLKLEAAIKEFGLQINNLICMDVGASTGGFTDCLLQNSANKVFAIDVGYGQLAWKLRQDSRVIIIERTNIRYLGGKKIPLAIDLATVDVSFISLKIVVPSILKFLKNKGEILALIKPQFEVGKGKIGKNGVVKDPKLHKEVINDLCLYFSNLGLECKAIMPSPILGPKGNREFILYLSV